MALQNDKSVHLCNGLDVLCDDDDSPRVPCEEGGEDPHCSNQCSGDPRDISLRTNLR